MTFNFTIIDKIINAVIPVLPPHFGLNYDDPSPDKFTSLSLVASDNPCEDLPILPYITKVLNELDIDSITVHYGASKFVIRSPYLDGIVIKIPFHGYYEDKTWYEFKNAAGVDKNDYCYLEYEKYQNLKAHNLGCFAAKTWFYKTVQGYNIILQEEVISESDNYDTKSLSKKSKDLAKSFLESADAPFTVNWLANCIEVYGQKQVEKFFNYCEEVDNDILDDMYEHNYGYRLNGTSCMLDFSNYAS